VGQLSVEKMLREETGRSGPKRKRRAGRTTKCDFDEALLDTGTYRRSALKQKAPEEQYAQDQDERDDDDFDEAHGQIPYATGDLMPSNGRRSD
jgi:hypothetical protein